MRRKSFSGLLAIGLILVSTELPASAKIFGTSSQPRDVNGAMIYGEEGEKYPLVGTGGIRVIGGHRGIMISNWKTSAIQIDGSGISAGKMTPFLESADFTATGTCVYFVERSAVCTLDSALGQIGSEIVVCNAGDGATITYRTTNDQALLGGDQSAPIVNSTHGKVDRFISDGKSWYKE